MYIYHMNDINVYLGRQKGVRGLNDSEDKPVVAIVRWLESCPFTKLK